MNIKISRKTKKALKKQNIATENAKREMLRLLEPYKTKLPDDFTLYFRKVDTLGNSSSFSNKVSLDTKFISDYMTASKSEKEMYKLRILECIGHELGHKRVSFNYLWFYAFTSANSLFLPRLVEVYCDHYSTKFTGLSRDSHKKILNWHIGEKHRRRDPHPSWEDRISYLDQEFGESLIRKIANDNHCTDAKMINYQIEYYKKVEENDGYKPKINTVCGALSLFILVAFAPMLFALVYFIYICF